MKRIIKQLCKLYDTKTVFYDGLFYSVLTGNKAIMIRVRGKQFIECHRMIFAQANIAY